MIIHFKTHLAVNVKDHIPKAVQQAQQGKAE